MFDKRLAFCVGRLYNKQYQHKKGMVVFMKMIKQFLKAMCYVALYFIMQYVMVFAASFAYSIFLGVKLGLSGEDMQSLDSNQLNLQIAEGVMSATSYLIILAGILSILILVVWFRLRRKRLCVEACLGSFDKRFLPAVFLGSMGLCLMINFGMELLPISEEALSEYSQATELLMQSPFWVLFLCNVVMAPLVEEILFRGLALSRLREAFPDGVALLISSAIFGLAHGQIIWICYTFVVGLVLGYVMLKTGSGRACILMHACFNLFGTVVGSIAMPISIGNCFSLAVFGALLIAMSAIFMERVSKQILPADNL